MQSTVDASGSAVASLAKSSAAERRPARPYRWSASESGRVGDLPAAVGEAVPWSKPAKEPFWPHARGQVGQYSVTELLGPANFTADLKWKWQHPDGRYHTTIVGAPLIDGDSNFYLTTEDGIRKFDREGTQIWHFTGPSDLTTCPSLMDGALFAVSHSGHAFALDTVTCELRWVRRVAQSVSGDTSYVEVYKGLVLLAVEEDFNDVAMTGGNAKVLALSARTGEQVWEYSPQRPLYNFMPVFPGNGSVVFMDFTGGVYGLDLKTGHERWYSAPREDSKNSFSVGGVMPGHKGVLFVCSNAGEGKGQEGTFGYLRSLSQQDGRQLWSRELPQPCNVWPAVSADAKTVIVPTGSFPGMPGVLALSDYLTEDEKLEVHLHALELGEDEQELWHNPDRHSGVRAYDAETGDVLWEFEAPASHRIAAAGDTEGFLERHSLGIRPLCMPPPWTSPTIAGDGAVYLGHSSGLLYKLRGPSGSEGVQVSSFETEAGYLHPGATFAPGVMAVASCDTLYVFRA